MNIRQFSHSLRPILSRSLIGDLHVPFSLQRFEEHEQVANTMPPIFVIDPFWLPRLEGKRLANFLKQLFGSFIHTHVGPLGIIGSNINLQYIFHVTDKGSIGFGWDAMFLFQPRLKFIFLSVV
jgi:hypothetical protein